MVLRPRDLHRITALLSLSGEDMPSSEYSKAVAATADGMDFVDGMDYVIQRLQTEETVDLPSWHSCRTSTAIYRAKGIQ